MHCPPRAGGKSVARTFSAAPPWDSWGGPSRGPRPRPSGWHVHAPPGFIDTRQNHRRSPETPITCNINIRRRLIKHTHTLLHTHTINQNRNNWYSREILTGKFDAGPKRVSLRLKFVHYFRVIQFSAGYFVESDDFQFFFAAPTTQFRCRNLIDSHWSEAVGSGSGFWQVVRHWSPVAARIIYSVTCVCYYLFFIDGATQLFIFSNTSVNLIILTCLIRKLINK